MIKWLYSKIIKVFNRRAIIKSRVRWRFSDSEKVFYFLWQLIMTFGNKTVWSYLPRPRFSKHAIVKKKQLRLFPYTHIQHKYAHTHTHTCPFPLLQLYNLNATDSLAKTSRAHLVIAVYFGMQRNSVIHDHVKLMASVSVEMKRRWEESTDRRCWSPFLPALLPTVKPPPPWITQNCFRVATVTLPLPFTTTHQQWSWPLTYHM